MIPENIMKIVITLLLGGALCLIAGVVTICTRKKISLEVWISLLALCVLGMIGFFAVAICMVGALVAAR